MERSGMEAPERRCVIVYPMYSWERRARRRQPGPCMVDWPSHNTQLGVQNYSRWLGGGVFVRALYFYSASGVINIIVIQYGLFI